MEQQGIILKNYMEDMVDECLASVLRKQRDSKLCTCPRCVLEIKKEALNRLPCFYVTGKVGEVYGEYRLKEQQHSTDIMIAVSSAIEIVANRGHHFYESGVTAGENTSSRAD